jgi:hypothetical protein
VQIIDARGSIMRMLEYANVAASAPALIDAAECVRDRMRWHGRLRFAWDTEGSEI